MKTTQYGVLIASLLSTFAMASPVAEPIPADLAEAATYKITCTGGLDPDSRCKNGKKENGCRCDSKGTYLCDPSSLKNDQCKKCGCTKA